MPLSLQTANLPNPPNLSNPNPHPILTLGAEFTNMETARKTLLHHTIAANQSFHVDKANRDKYFVSCRAGPSCPFKIRIYTSRKTGRPYVQTCVTAHRCPPETHLGWKLGASATATAGAGPSGGTRKGAGDGFDTALNGNGILNPEEAILAPAQDQTSHAQGHGQKPKKNPALAKLEEQTLQTAVQTYHARNEANIQTPIESLAAEFNAPYHRLRSRIQGRSRGRPRINSRLTDAQTKSVVDYLDLFARVNPAVEVTPRMVQDVAHAVLRRDHGEQNPEPVPVLGKGWVYGFLRAQPCVAGVVGRRKRKRWGGEDGDGDGDGDGEDVEGEGDG